MHTGLLFALAILSLILIPLAPKLVRLRIRIHRWIHWNWSVNLLEKHFDGWVLIFRIVLFVIAAVLLFVGWVNLRDSSVIDEHAKKKPGELMSIICAKLDASLRPAGTLGAVADLDSPRAADRQLTDSAVKPLQCNAASA